ncbi:MAG: bifunctional folylpolyglutamate synthase/dihydrofolate synthase [candidate division WOR-3 bacterium]|nr:bifunctional folylpolyglutamate synthase/dihydrofolate synthase [candidate division WOR-3 bacterium]
MMKPEDFLNSLVNYEKIPGYKYDLGAFKEFLKKIGSPHERLINVILIAGTKGKGSTATMIHSCLVASGYKAGLFTSPHLKKITERIKINNQEITEKEMEKYIRIIKPHINFKTRIGARTFFEVLTTIAFMYFAEKKVDFAVLEVGLGGRLDATNVFDIHIPVITRIGYDHMNLLGNKLSQIAFEKAGIIPESKVQNEIRPVITIRQRPSVNRVLTNVARQRNHRIIFADDLHKVTIKDLSIKGTKVSIKGALGRFDAILSLIGRHHIENLMITLAVLFELRKKGFKISISGIKRGIKNSKLPGRFEILSKKPLIIYDVAHNEDSFRALLDNIRLLYNFRNLQPSGLQKRAEKKSDFAFERESKNNLYMIFGCNKDKEINYAVKNLFPLAREVLLVRTGNPRSMEPATIYESAHRYQKNIVIANSIKNAFLYLKERIEKKSTILIFGSFYMYNECLSVIKRMKLNE